MASLEMTRRKLLRVISSRVTPGTPFLQQREKHRHGALSRLIRVLVLGVFTGGQGMPKFYSHAAYMCCWVREHPYFRVSCCCREKECSQALALRVFLPIVTAEERVCPGLALLHRSFIWVLISSSPDPTSLTSSARAQSILVSFPLVYRVHLQ